MYAIEVTTFRLADGADEDAFLEADRRVQTEFMPNQPGFMRRTTARADDGEWLVVVLWVSEADGQAATEASEDDAATAELRALVNESTFETKRYSTLD